MSPRALPKKRSDRAPSSAPGARRAKGDELVYCEVDGLPAEIDPLELSTAGLFVETPTPLPIDSEVEVFVRIAEMRFQSSGFVVQSVSCELARAKQRRPGYGLLFTNVDEAARTRLGRAIDAQLGRGTKPSPLGVRTVSMPDPTVPIAPRPRESAAPRSRRPSPAPARATPSAAPARATTPSRARAAVSPTRAASTPPAGARAASTPPAGASSARTRMSVTSAEPVRANPNARMSVTSAEPVRANPNARMSVTSAEPVRANPNARMSVTSAEPVRAHANVRESAAPRARAPSPPRASKLAPAPISPEEQELLQKLRAELQACANQTPWAILAISQGADAAQAKAAYFAASKRYHPHLYAHYPTPEIKQVVTELFIVHKRAYTTLLKSGKPSRGARA